jgi:hypothetical protein
MAFMECRAFPCRIDVMVLMGHFRRQLADTPFGILLGFIKYSTKRLIGFFEMVEYERPGSRFPSLI